MAKVNPEEIVDDLSREFRRALSDAASNTLPDVEFDDRELFRAFKRAVRRRCSTWEQVSDRHVKAD